MVNARDVPLFGSAGHQDLVPRAFLSDQVNLVIAEGVGKSMVVTLDPSSFCHTRYWNMGLWAIGQI